MAVVQNPIIGRARGQAGGMVFTTQFGRNVLKSKALSVANPKTDKQLGRRAAMTQTVALYRSIAPVVQAGFRSKAIGMSAYNAFSSFNIKQAYSFEASGKEIQIPAKSKVSVGTIKKESKTASTQAAAAKDVVVTFPTTFAGAGQSASDKVAVVVVNETKGETAFSFGKAIRSEGTSTVTMPSNLTAEDVLHIYLGFIRDDGTDASDSTYSTEIVGA